MQHLKPLEQYWTFMLQAGDRHIQVHQNDPLLGVSLDCMHTHRKAENDRATQKGEDSHLPRALNMNMIICKQCMSNA